MCVLERSVMLNVSQEDCKLQYTLVQGWLASSCADLQKWERARSQWKLRCPMCLRRNASEMEGASRWVGDIDTHVTDGEFLRTPRFSSPQICSLGGTEHPWAHHISNTFPLCLMAIQISFNYHSTKGALI